MSETTTPKMDEPLKVVAVVEINNEEALILNRPLHFIYTQVGKDYVGADGPFRDLFYYGLATGSKTAFAGREITITMQDGATKTLQHHWWSGLLDGHVGVGYGDVEAMKKCYVINGGACIDPQELVALRATYTGPVYRYRDFEKLIKFDDMRTDLTRRWLGEERKRKAVVAVVKSKHRELTAANARIAELEGDVKHARFLCEQSGNANEWQANQIESLTRQLSESEEKLKLALHDAAQESMKVVKLQSQLSESQAQLDSAKEEADHYRRSFNGAIKQRNEARDQLASAREGGQWDEGKHAILPLDSARGVTKLPTVPATGRPITQEEIDGDSPAVSETGEKDAWHHTIQKCSACGHEEEVEIQPPSATDSWQDISTAPKDGTFLAWVDGCGQRVVLSVNGYITVLGDNYANRATISAWLELPPPPQGKETK